MNETRGANKEAAVGFFICKAIVNRACRISKYTTHHFVTLDSISISLEPLIAIFIAIRYLVKYEQIFSQRYAELP